MEASTSALCRGDFILGSAELPRRSDDEDGPSALLSLKNFHSLRGRCTGLRILVISGSGLLDQVESVVDLVVIARVDNVCGGGGFDAV